MVCLQLLLPYIILIQLMSSLKGSPTTVKFCLRCHQIRLICANCVSKKQIIHISCKTSYLPLIKSISSFYWILHSEMNVLPYIQLKSWCLKIRHRCFHLILEVIPTRTLSLFSSSVFCQFQSTTVHYLAWITSPCLILDRILFRFPLFWHWIISSISNTLTV